ncbi:hypothetical protein GUITHDRAFT_100947 [Guillardia theta CCMP2712]|uniref:Uncharacterized protein n=1 Tax=Guillardia theta (strain CCMP2712) TaxID=905079 RepID=L1JYE9_GUITC|nr:hypothetical protein GUITHDRAFT_100947 [Guillardia theta CCMP2712]EKX53240.1 hypothetical protein GUITHDRAFT_100947 [Guillardia theta CCMP2712]|eukprot:XP_005840220.1 hypothetical protein GUITHDRAFT_100947 [Guillardia theta CCMP2712]
MIKSYFNGASVIDVHNHLRQSGLGLEEKVGTHGRLEIQNVLYRILGFIEVDAYKIFRIGMPPKEFRSQRRGRVKAFGVH